MALSSFYRIPKFSAQSLILGRISFLGSSAFDAGEIAYRSAGLLGVHRMTIKIGETPDLLTLRPINNTTTNVLELANGAVCTKGGMWQNSCSATLKDLHQLTAGNDILNKINRLPVYNWSYKVAPETVHLGPTAEDFYEIFGVGSDPTKLSAVDLAGASMAAIKALYELILTQTEEINSLKNKIK